MPKVYAIDGITPVVHPSAYVHPSAVPIGDVIVGARAYIHEYDEGSRCVDRGGARPQADRYPRCRPAI